MVKTLRKYGRERSVITKKQTFVTVCMCFFTLSITLLAPRAAAEDSTLENTKSVLETLIQHELDNGLPSVSLSLIQDGKIVWSAAYGYANVRMKVPATPETIYHTASTFKPVTATAILTLVDQGKCSLDDPVNKYLGEHKVKDNPENSVTIRHLLDHTSGLTAGSNTVELWQRKLPQSLEDVAAMVRQKNPVGEKYTYNNYAYGIAGLLIEKISGMSFEEYVLAHILVPLGVTTPHPVNPSPDMIEVMALPYGITPKGTPTPIAMERSDTFPAGDIYLTAEDMVRFLAAHINKGSYNGTQILSKESIDEAHRPHLENYGLGWIIKKEENGHTVIHHQGGVSGFTTFMIGDADTGEGAYVMTNASGSRSAVAIANAAFKLLRGDSYTLPKKRIVVDIEPAKLERLLGKYVNARTPGINGPPEVIFTLEDGRLVLTYGVDRKVYFDTISETTFYSKQLSMDLIFEVDKAGKIKSMNLVGDNYDLLANRVEK